MEQVVQSTSVVNCICCQLHCLHLHRWCLSPPRRSWSCTRRSQLGTQALWSQRPRGCSCRPLLWSPVVGSYKRNGPTRCSRRISFKCDMLGALNKVVYFACSHPWSNILIIWIILILKLGSLLYEWFSLAPITLSGRDRFPNCALQPVLVLYPLLSDDSFSSFRPLSHLLQPFFHINFHYSDHYCQLCFLKTLHLSKDAVLPGHFVPLRGLVQVVPISDKNLMINKFDIIVHISQLISIIVGMIWWFDWR